MVNIQVKSPTLQITESGKDQQYLEISEVQTFSHSATESSINFSLEDKESNMLDTNS